jgi:hypothetical protein
MTSWQYDEAGRSDLNPEATSTGKVVNAEQLVAVGLRLARPSLVLRASSSGGKPVGWWGGMGTTPSPAGDWRNWLTVDCGWLLGHGIRLQGCMSLYESRGDDTRFAAVMAAKQALPRSVPGE